MKESIIETAIIRRFDDMGAIRIPRVIREELYGNANIEGKLMEICYKKDGTIILKPIN